MTAIDVMLQQPAAHAIGWALVQFIWQGTLIGVVTAAVLVALRRSAADIRYVVASIALLLMLTLPVVTVTQSLSSPSPRDVGVGDATPLEPAMASVVAPEPIVERRATVDAPLGAQVPRTDDTFTRWLPLFLGVWLAGVAMLTLRLLSGWIWVQRLKTRGAQPSDATVDALARRLTRQLHIGRGIRFLESTAVDVPTVIGWLKPVVLLPASVLAGLTPQQLEAVLAHELAHIRRHDYLVNLLQTVVETLLFYHPAVWWLSRRIRIERENCCDDLAVSLCGDPVTYAAALAEMEGLRSRGSQLVLAANGGLLLQRVRRLLGAPSHAGRAPGWLAAGIAVVVIAGISASSLGNDGSASRLLLAQGSSSDGDRFREHPEPPQPPEPPGPPAPPEPPEPPELPEHLELPEPPELPDFAELSAVVEQSVAEALEQVRRGMSSPLPRERATRRCIDWVRDSLPVQFHGTAHAVRGVCQALASVREVMHDSEHRAARAHQAMAAAAPAAVEAVAEPLAQAAAAVAEASRESAEHLEPLLAEVSRAIEEAQRTVAHEISRATTAPALADISRAFEEAQRSVAARTRANQASTRSERDGQKTGNYTWSNDGERFEVNFRGDFEFTDDDADLRSLTPGGWLRITERRRSGPDYTVEFDADRDGRIQRRYRVDGTEQAFEPEGRKRAAEMLLRFIRQSAAGAAERVARIYRSKGTAGVFAEIRLLEGSWPRRIYYSELLKLPSIASRDVQQTLAQAGTEIESDFELASLLLSATHLVKDEATRKAYFDAARTIGSDFEMRRVFSGALKSGPVAPALLAGVLDASTAIDSDFEAASLLVQIAGLQPIEGVTRAPFFRALDTVSSAFERRRVLTAVLKRSDLSSDVLGSSLESAAMVASDFECASVLLQFVKAHPVEGAVRAPFFKAVGSIDSAFERGRVLQAVARRADASDDTVLNVIRSATTMNGGFEKAQVLLTVAGSHELTREGRDAYIDASQRLGDFEQRRVLSALARREGRR